MGTKLGNIKTYRQNLTLLKVYDPFIIWPYDKRVKCEVMQQDEKTLPPLTQDLRPLDLLSLGAEFWSEFQNASLSSNSWTVWERQTKYEIWLKESNQESSVKQYDFSRIKGVSYKLNNLYIAH